MKKIIVCALAANHTIGNLNELVWALPKDTAHYYKTVKGGWAIMGRRTFESNYGNISVKKIVIVSRNPHYRPANAGTAVAPSLEAALRTLAHDALGESVFILGGGEIYQLAMPIADEMVLTHVKAEIVGDAFFPPIDYAQWEVVHREAHSADEEHLYDFEFVHYRRR